MMALPTIKRAAFLIPTFFLSQSVLSLDLTENRLYNFKATGNPLIDISGFYISAQGGYADTHWDNININDVARGVSRSTTHTTGGAFAVLLGYQYHYFGIEAGYYGLPTTHVTTGVPATATTSAMIINSDIENYVLSFVGKMTLPIGDRLGVYAKAGMADFSSTTSTLFVTVANNSSNSADYIGPAFGLGADFAVTPHWIVEASWMRFTGQGSITNDIEPYQPNPDVFLVGLTYRITTSSDAAV